MQRIFTFLFLFLGFIIYSSFVYTTGTAENNIVMNKNAIFGKLLYQKNNCTACPQIYGLGGYLGPELTTVISQQNKGETNARSFIQTGKQKMPDFN